MFTQLINAIDVTKVTHSCLNSINASGVILCHLGVILETSWGHHHHHDHQAQAGLWLAGPRRMVGRVQFSRKVTFLLQKAFISSDRSSCSDDGRLSINPLFQIFTQSIDAIDVTSFTLSRLNSVNAIDVTRCKLMLIEC